MQNTARKLRTEPRNPLREIPLHAVKYLGPLLPTGWVQYFTPRHAGKYWGLSVRCPLCQEVPPPELHYNSRKWRWLSVHVAQHREKRRRHVGIK